MNLYPYGFVGISMSPVNLSLVRPVCGIGNSAVSEGSISGSSGGLESSESMGSGGGSATR